MPLRQPKQVFPTYLQKGLQSGAIKKFDTLEDLAKNYNIPFDAFKDEIARWNAFVEKKKDPDFDCMIFPEAKPTDYSTFLCRQTVAQGPSYHGRIGY